jgi:acetylxylan esterase
MRTRSRPFWILLPAGIASAALIAVALALAITQPPSPPPSSAPSSPGPVVPARLVQVRSFGANPTGLGMYLYVPNRLRPDPAILVAAHGCTESGPYFYETTGFSTLADEYGFIVIYPSSSEPDGCWDTSSAGALRPDGGSDPEGIMSMITYTERRYHANPGRVYVTGASSGGMMASVLLGDYPNVFAAGAIFMGVPFGCNLACASIPTTLTPAQWGAVVRNADPGYHGPRPRVQIWHGTADANVLYANFGQEISQWTDVLGVSQTPLATDHPEPGWTRTVYGPNENDIEVEAYRILGAGHDLPQAGMEAYVISFFGLGQG